MRGLLELRPAFAGLAVYPDDFRSLAKGLRRCYRATRKAFQHAFDTGRDEDLHEWRKGVQHHWRQMQLLAPCWPSELSARVEAAKLAVADCSATTTTSPCSAGSCPTPTMMFGTPDETAAFLKRCRKRQRSLRKEARAEGERLFAERARPFAERIESIGGSPPAITAKPLPKARPRMSSPSAMCGPRRALSSEPASRPGLQTLTSIPS